jgi:hypothetical protein
VNETILWPVNGKSDIGMTGTTILTFSGASYHTFHVMLSLQQTLLDFLPNDLKISDGSKVIKLLPFVLIIIQLAVSFGRAVRKISFSSHGLSFHSRYVANINFLTNAVGVVEKGYNKASAITLPLRGLY